MFEQEKSIVALGEKTLAVLLPAIWVHKNQVQKGDLVIMEISETELRIHKKRTEKVKN